MISRRAAPCAALIAVAASAVVCLGAFVIPLYSSSSSHGLVRNATLVEVNGVRVVVVLAIPVVIATLGLLATVGRLPHFVLPAACALMCTWTVVTGFSVGLLYFPAAAALLVAVAARPKATVATRQQRVSRVDLR